jgi:hypothetical protein
MNLCAAGAQFLRRGERSACGVNGFNFGKIDP